jgi:hypothetical protein
MCFAFADKLNGVSMSHEKWDIFGNRGFVLLYSVLDNCRLYMVESKHIA